MDWARWEPWYEAILEDMGYDRAEDEAARDGLRDLLASRDPAGPGALEDLFSGETVVVVGAGPSLPSLTADDVPAAGEAPLVACDAAAGRLLEVGRVPEAVVTDLDGPAEALVEANRLGALLVVHAHGDNRAVLDEVVPRLPGPVHGTTQAEPRPPVRNWGGFTDGDRAAHTAAHHGAAALRLRAFDLDDPGPGPTADQGEKARKLAWARRLLALVDVPVEGVDLDLPGDVTPP